jgi:hypothetical protein
MLPSLKHPSDTTPTTAPTGSQEEANHLARHPRGGRNRKAQKLVRRGVETLLGYVTMS